MGKGLNRHFSNKDTPMDNKHMKGCSASLVTREGQSKSMRCHLIPARAARHTMLSVGDDAKNLELILCL